MKVFIKNKFISLGGDSDILNENQEPIFRVKGKAFTFTKKKMMYDKDGALLYTIRNRYWNFFFNKVFIYNENKERVATIKKNKWSFNRRFQIEDTADAMEISGKLFSRESKIIQNGEPVATITKEFSLVNDTFTLEAKDEDIAFMTALVIAFDNLQDKRLNQRD